MNTTQPSDVPAAPARKRRMWLRVLLIVAGVLVLLVILAPSLASTGPARRAIVHMANGRLKGRLAIDDLRLGWSGPTAVKGIRLDDPQGRTVVNVAGASIQKGLWSLLWHHSALGDVQLDQPHVDLIVNPDGQISLATIFPPSPPTPPGQKLSPTLTQLTLHAHLAGGQVRLIQADGRQLQVANLDVTAEVASLDHLQTTVSAELAGGAIKVTEDLRGLLKDGRLDVASAAGTLSVQTDKPLNIQPLADLANLTPGGHSAGTFNLKVDVSIAPDNVKGVYNAALAGVKMARAGDKQLEDLNLALSGQVGLTDKALSLATALAGTSASLSASTQPANSPGQLIVTVQADRQSLSRRPEMQKITDAVLNGGTLNLPQATVSAKGDLNLPALARSVPALLGLREGLAVSAGAVHLDVQAGTAGQPDARGTLALSAIQAQADGRPINVEPMDAAFHVFLPAEKPLQVESIKLTAPFADATASGQADNLNATVKLDLDALQNRLETLFTWAGPKLAGTMNATLAIRRPDAHSLDFQTTGGLQNAQVLLAGQTQPMKIAQGSFAAKAAVQLDAGNHPRTVQLDSLDAHLDATRLQASGQYSLADGSSTGFSVVVTATDLAAVSQLGSALPAWPAGLSLAGQGTITITGTLRDKVLVVSDNTTKLTAFRASGPSLGAVNWPTATLSAPLKYDLQAGRLDVSGGSAGSVLSCPWGDVSATLTVWPAKKGLQGQVKLARWDLAQMTTSLQPLLGLGTGHLVGTLAVQADFTAPGAGIQTAGQVTIADFGTDKQKLSATPMTLSWKDVAIDPSAKTIRLAAAKLASDIAGADIANATVGYAPGQLALQADAQALGRRGGLRRLGRDAVAHVQPAAAVGQVRLEGRRGHEGRRDQPDWRRRAGRPGRRPRRAGRPAEARGPDPDGADSDGRPYAVRRRVRGQVGHRHGEPHRHGARLPRPAAAGPEGPLPRRLGPGHPAAAPVLPQHGRHGERRRHDGPRLRAHRAAVGRQGAQGPTGGQLGQRHRLRPEPGPRQPAVHAGRRAGDRAGRRDHGQSGTDQHRRHRRGGHPRAGGERSQTAGWGRGRIGRGRGPPVPPAGHHPTGQPGPHRRPAGRPTAQPRQPDLPEPQGHLRPVLRQPPAGQPPVWRRGDEGRAD